MKSEAVGTRSGTALATDCDCGVLVVKLLSGVRGLWMLPLVLFESLKRNERGLKNKDFRLDEVRVDLGVEVFNGVDIKEPEDGQQIGVFVNDATSVTVFLLFVGVLISGFEVQVCVGVFRIVFFFVLHGVLGDLPVDCLCTF